MSVQMNNSRTATFYINGKKNGNSRAHLHQEAVSLYIQCQVPLNNLLQHASWQFEQAAIKKFVILITF